MALVTLDQCPVPYKILYRTPKTLRGSTTAGWTSSLCFLVRHADLDAFAVFAGGQVYTVPLSGGGTAQRLIPLSHPDYPSLLCQDVDCECTGTFDPTLPASRQNWDLARVKLTFSSVPYPIDGSTPFMTTETEEGVEVVTMAGKKLVFPDGSPIQADAGVEVHTMTYRVTIFLAVALDDNLIRPLVGKVNSVTTLGCDPGTLKFGGMTARVQTTTTAQTAYTRSLTATWREFPWNLAMKNTGVWDTPVKPDGSYLYQSADISVAFS